MKRTGWTVGTVALLICGAGAGCDDGSPIIDLETPADGVETRASAVVAPTIFTWVQGQPDKKMVSADGNICTLTLVQGRFMGGGERVRVWIKSDGFWYIGGISQQTGVAGAAYCVPFGNFLGGPTKAHSGEYTDLPSEDAGWPSTGCKFDGGTRTWAGDAATWLTRVSGEFNQSGDKARIFQESDAFRNSEVYGGDCKNDITAGAHSFYVGDTLHRKPAVFRGPNGVGDAAVASEWSVTTPSVVTLASRDQHLCYLTEINGVLQSANDSVRLLSESGNWSLSVMGGVRVKARCFLYDQR
jgi:hypothetical protein